MFKNLMKAAVGLVVETPIALVEDSVTMCGVLNDKAEPATVTALKKVAQNVAQATEPKERR